MSCDTRTEHLRNLWGLATSLLVVQTEVQHLSNSAMSAQWVYISEILYHSILSVKQNQLKSVSELGIIRIKYTLKWKSIYNSHRMKSSLNLCVILPLLGSLKPCESFSFVIILFRLISKFVLFLAAGVILRTKKNQGQWHPPQAFLICAKQGKIHSLPAHECKGTYSHIVLDEPPTAQFKPLPCLRVSRKKAGKLQSYTYQWKSQKASFCPVEKQWNYVHDLKNKNKNKTPSKKTNPPANRRYVHIGMIIFRLKEYLTCCHF